MNLHTTVINETRWFLN